MTTQFVTAAQTMGRVLGLPGYSFAIIDHPVSSATDEALREKAKVALAQGGPLLLLS